MTRLALTLPPSPFEMPTSYLSRLAARNFSEDLETFCSDLGIDLGALSNGDMAVVRQINHLAGLPSDSFSQTTVVKTSTMKYRIGDEAMNTETFARTEIRFCPVCVAQDLAGGADPWNAIHYMHWQITQVRACWRHGVALSRHRQEANGFAGFDVTTLLRRQAQLNRLSDGDSQPKADAFDRYLSERIYGKHSASWCNELEIPALWKACEAFGVLMNHGHEARASKLPPQMRRDAMLTGFLILNDGPESIRSALDRYNRSKPRTRNQPHPSNGEVQRMLGSHRKMRSDLDPLRDIVREYFLENYPHSPGCTVLGVKLEQRRVHSMHSASRAIPVRRSVLEDMLIRRNLATRDANGAFRLKAVLKTELVDELRRERDNYLDQQQTADYLGCSFAMFKQLKLAGVLVPAGGAEHRARKGYRKDQLDDFLEALFAGTNWVPDAQDGTATIDLATRKANCTVPDIVRLLLEGKLTATGRLTRKFELNALLVQIDALNAALRRLEPNGYTLSKTCKILHIDFTTLKHLIELGFFSLERMKNNQTRFTAELIPATSVERFRSQYCTIGMIRERRQFAKRALHDELRAAGVDPIYDELGRRRLYRWRDLPEGLLSPREHAEGSSDASD
ncbi:TniQ family protein [Ruegeria sp. 2012CJ41-6]|uniref:TniQ family protein n=1 Tax=Ruegeria spongiae TaxID=2942209 RepID=A0ABT0Q8J9_9RHOB|nr:TniQ family protein [Ruegeria spongiae]MCL6285737.1 TniQ family protein [Ruegeria spongiae]